jgi:hypothetical protein
VLNPPSILLALKAAVILVTVLLLASLAALTRGRYRLHGQINRVVFVLTLTALLGLEGLARLVNPGLFQDYFDRTDAWTGFYVHLIFAVPTAALLCIQFYTGLHHHRRLHVALGLCFLALWTGTFITGVFFLPPALGR